MGWSLIVSEEWQPPITVELEPGLVVRYCQVLSTNSNGSWVCGREIANPTDSACKRHTDEGLCE